ncbi:MAG TPA: TetR/AcrR family transcriptional regulator [Mycobacteriales bacterium]|nr:TetR/AcrR family transcriptional regulator [Mycobacteriales bacterium]
MTTPMTASAAGPATGRGAVAESGPRPPGRPRSSHADAAIIDAVLGLLTEGTSIEALTMEAVAARAGVGKATIYRRFADKDELVLAAVQVVKPPPPEPAGESVRADLVAIARHSAKVRKGLAAQIMPCMVPELQRPGRLRDLYRQMLEDRREVLRSVIRRGITTGELRPDTDVELAAVLLSAPGTLSALGFAPRLDEDDLAERTIDTVLRGIAGPA